MASISKRTDGTWLGQVNQKGKRKSFYGKTKKEVEKKIQAYLEDLNKYGSELDKTNETVASWLYIHLFTNVHNKVSNSTYDRYMNLYNRHIKDTTFGKMIINQVKQVHVQEYFNNTDISASGQGMLRYLLKQSFDFAINNNLMRVNPVVNIKIKSKNKTKKDIEIFTLDEQEKFMSVLHTTKYSLFFMTALFTGMRLGELVALKWKNVDSENNTISVKESYKRTTIYNNDGSTHREIDKKEPKTKNSIRTIPIPPTLMKKLLLSKTESEYVFPSSTGSHMTPENIRRIQISLCKKAEIPYHNFHALRHTYATRLIENGFDIKTVSELLGHADVNITLSTYVHSTNDTKINAVNALEKLYFEKMH